MRIAISGCGVAGPTLAYWLLQAGHEPTLIEAAPALRNGGYMIDFWGVGFDVADRMGLLPAVRAAGYDLEHVLYVDQRGRVGGGISAETMRRELRDRLPASAVATSPPRSTGTSMAGWRRALAPALPTSASNWTLSS